jgi:cation transport ATPase
VSDLKPGDAVLVKPGERVPSDGLVVEGRTSLDESMLTGESRPVTRRPGDQVIGGAASPRALPDGAWRAASGVADGRPRLTYA